MPRQDLSAVRNAVEVTLRPIPRRVKSDWHPEITTSSQQKAKEKSTRACVEYAQPGFAGVAEVGQAETRGQSDRSRPESDGLG